MWASAAHWNTPRHAATKLSFRLLIEQRIQMLVVTKSLPCPRRRRLQRAGCLRPLLLSYFMHEFVCQCDARAFLRHEFDVQSTG